MFLPLFCFIRMIFQHALVPFDHVVARALERADKREEQRNQVQQAASRNLGREEINKVEG